MIPHKALFIVIVSILGASACQGADPRLEQIIRDWENRRDRVAVARYKISGQRTFVDLGRDHHGVVADKRPKADDSRLPFELSYLFDFKNNRHRREANEAFPVLQDRTKATKKNQIDAFNAKEFRTQFLNTDDANPESDCDLVIRTGSFTKLNFGALDQPMFFAHGRSWYPDRWTFTLYNGTQVELNEVAQVASREFDLPVSESDFNLPVAPGMRITKLHITTAPHPMAEATFEEQKFVVSKNGRLVPLGADGKPSYSFSWAWGLAAMLGTLVAAILVVLRLRRRKSQPDSSSP